MIRLDIVWNDFDVGFRVAVCKALGFEGVFGSKDYQDLPNDLKDSSLFRVLIKRGLERKRRKINE